MRTSSLERSWYRQHGWSLLLVPLSLLFGLVVHLRRAAYRIGWLKVVHIPVPVIVVGNITVGGSGKTPVTAYLASQLHDKGLKVGIVSRGYGGKASAYPLPVHTDTPAGQAGDEPILLASRGDAQVVVDPIRSRAAQLLVEQYGVDIILADDGLQHYALGRDTEIAVVDGARGYGNGWLLPAGPLREPRSRLANVAMQLEHGGHGDFSLVPAGVQQLAGNQVYDLANFPQRRVHAVAGIGAPERFFAMLRQYGFEVVPHAFPDHHDFRASDIRFDDELPVLMTEKDAVKCRPVAQPNHWFVPVNARFTTVSQQRLEALIEHWTEQALHNRKRITASFGGESV